MRHVQATVNLLVLVVAVVAAVAAAVQVAVLQVVAVSGPLVLVAADAQDQVGVEPQLELSGARVENQYVVGNQSGRNAKNSNRCKRHPWAVSLFHVATVLPLSGCVTALRYQILQTKLMRTRQVW